MKIHTAGNPDHPVILFFHAMGVVGESSERPAEYLKERYFVIMPTLSAYCKGKTMKSKEAEMQELADSLQNMGIRKIELIVASSLGADFAMTFLLKSGIPVNKVFFDGGQFAQIPAMTRKIMVPFLYLTIKSLYWSKGKTLKKILWCDDAEIQPYFIKAGEGLDYASLKAMMRDCLVDQPFPPIPEEMQKKIVFEFGSVEDHFKYRDAVRQAYPYASFPVFRDLNHMQYQIRHPEQFAHMLQRCIEEDQVLRTGEYTGEQLNRMFA